jgi:hypothetical protein
LEHVDDAPICRRVIDLEDLAQLRDDLDCETWKGTIDDEGSANMAE